MQPLKINVCGIKCDNKECGFNDMTVKFEDYDKWLNKPCPECGSNLLTQKDYSTTKALVWLTKIINKVMPKAKGDEPLFKVSANFNGTGEVTFSDIELVEKGGE